MAGFKNHEELPPATESDLPFVVKFQIFYDDAEYSETDNYKTSDQFCSFITGPFIKLF